MAEVEAEEHTYYCGDDSGGICKCHACEEEYSRAEESDGEKNDGSSDDVDLLEVSLNEEGNDYRGDDADDETYDIGLETDNVVSDLVDEAAGEEEILYGSAYYCVARECADHEDGEGVELSREEREHHGEDDGGGIYGIYVLTDYREIFLNEGGDEGSTDVSTDSHTAEGECDLQELVAIFSKCDNQDSGENDGGDEEEAEHLTELCAGIEDISAEFLYHFHS